MFVNQIYLYIRFSCKNIVIFDFNQMSLTSWKRIILFCSFALFLWAIVFWLYGKYIDTLKDKEYVANCSYTLSAWIFSINAVCVQQKELPQLALVDIVNEVRDQIDWFSWYYEPFSTSFNYYWATPIFRTGWSPYLKWDPESEQLITDAVKKRKKITFTYNELAQYYAEHLSYFVSDKDLTNLWRCTRTNYLIALEWIDWVIMNPWDVFNVNKKLGSLKWYCKWINNESFSFYGWVCGMVSQLFRVSLVNPEIFVNNRFPHNERFVQYYWETVWWDDAAVYEYSKVFEIENLSNSDIIFKTRYEWNESILVAISWPTNKWINISKENIDWKETAVHLNKSVYEWDAIIREEIFDSFYSRKTYEIR